MLFFYRKKQKTEEKNLVKRRWSLMGGLGLQWGIFANIPGCCERAGGPGGANGDFFLLLRPVGGSFEIDQLQNATL